MLIERIKWTDYNGNEREKDFHFNFTESEIREMDLKTGNGLEQKLRKIVDEKDPEELVKYFKSLILDSYGVISEDGVRFEKSKELSTAFSQTGAYNELFMRLTSDTQAAIDFVNGIIPNVPTASSSTTEEPRKEVAPVASVDIV